MGTYLSTPVVRKELEDGVGPHNLRYASGSMQGWRISQEDAHMALPRFDEKRGLGLFGVFDGHCGGAVSKLAVKVLPGLLRKSAGYKEADYTRALNEAFLAFDKYVDGKAGRDEVRLQARRIQDELAGNFDVQGATREDMARLLDDVCADNPDGMGCTAIVALVEYGDPANDRPACVHVANCGDSRCVLWDEHGKAHPLSKDHKPRTKEERARVEAAGGWVTREGRIEGNLNLSRALADFEYKRSRRSGRPEDQMISGVPEVRTRVLRPSDRFLLLGCDGIWETRRGSQATIDVVRRSMPAGRRGRISVALKRLLNETIAKDGSTGYGMDNMTTVLVELPSVPHHRRGRKRGQRTIPTSKRKNGVVAKACVRKTLKTILKRPAAMKLP
eukprot:TRINITY_DN63343_c0_g1_i1.p1 TRINITY_DN63343_c0_g1~~TRINITY_DN63343_c0_g1_i1.p1  ORF type:complete len:388 (+),score=53.58 TRINITY_DN63343_c0_g1_i1:104-1267(+)